jgi:flagellar export protein FliJ
MPAFRFRAQPALDLRRREHDAAQRALARADAERQRARERVNAAERALMAARRDLDDVTRTPGSQHEHEWYRFWIVRLERERTSLQRVLTACEDAVVAARAACLTARQRCEALERFREKAYVAYVAAEASRDRKVIDELATRRFVARRNISEGA